MTILFTTCTSHDLSH